MGILNSYRNEWEVRDELGKGNERVVN